MPRLVHDGIVQSFATLVAPSQKKKVWWILLLREVIVDIDAPLWIISAFNCNLKHGFLFFECHTEVDSSDGGRCPQHL